MFLLLPALRHRFDINLNELPHSTNDIRDIHTINSNRIPMNCIPTICVDLILDLASSLIRLLDD